MSDLFDRIERVKDLHQLINVDEKAKRECKSYIANNISYFYSNLDPMQFIEIVDYYKDCFKDRESNIIDILKSKKIPYILGYDNYDGEINQNVIKENALSSYENDELIEALEYIKLLSQKYSLDVEVRILRGDILKELGEYNAAVSSYRSAKELKSLDFSANRKIATTKMLKYKKEIIITTSIIAIAIIGQYILFSTGTISSKFYNFDLHINNGKYIKEDINTVAIPLEGSIDIDISYKIMPFYGYEGKISYKIEDESIAKIDENNKLSGLAEGSTSLNVLKDGEIIHTYNIIVAKSKIEHIRLSVDNDLSSVGDTGKINAEVIRNYDFGEEDVISYKSTNEKVLTVQEDGTVEVVGAGKASIVATCDDLSVEEDFIIDLVIEDLIVEHDVEIEVDESHKLDISVVTNSEGSDHPKVMFELDNSDGNADKIISIDGDGNIKGIKEGIQIVNVSCGDKERSVMVKVNPKTIGNTTVENLKPFYEVKDETLTVGLTWDSIGIADSHEYEVYAKVNSNSEFKKVDTVAGASNGTLSSEVKFDLRGFNGVGSIDFYVIATNEDGKSEKSRVVNIQFSHESEKKKEK